MYVVAWRRMKQHEAAFCAHASFLLLAVIKCCPGHAWVLSEGHHAQQSGRVYSQRGAPQKPAGVRVLMSTSYLTLPDIFNLQSSPILL
eukprot:1137787-Pelagomonas_calceolata.AAC.1